MDLAKVLTTGANGTIGGYVDFGRKTGHAELDVTDPAAIRRFCADFKPEAVLHLAGEADVDRAEREPEKAYFLNSVGTYNLALAAREFGFKLVYLSTSGVFDGAKAEPYSSEDTPNPINHYGHSKYLGELAIRSLLKDYLIIRTDWVFGGGKENDKKLVGKTIARMNETELSGVSDQKGSPTYAKDLIQAIKTLLAENAAGIRHAVNSGPASQFEFMSEIARTLNSSAAVKPVSSANFKTDAPRWKNKVLASDVLLRPWQEALKEYLTTEWK